jgi:predicted outer membrane repeat protein
VRHGARRSHRAQSHPVTGGGGGAFGQNVALAFEGVTFDENSAAQAGGAFLALNGGSYVHRRGRGRQHGQHRRRLGFNGTMSIEITRGVLQRNRSNTVGGGFWKAGLSTLTMTGTQLLDNTAGTQGGGLQLVGPGGAATLTGQ